MRISKHFSLGQDQPTLDFVDVDVENDVPLFIDPEAIRTLPGVWTAEAQFLVSDFFQTVIKAVRAGDLGRAAALLACLQEPNETHLGLSQGASRGHAMGEILAARMAVSLARSDAVRTGLVQDLQDTALLVPGVGVDIVSDIATNLIRQPLINYTHAMAGLHSIPLTQDVYVGPVWDPRTQTWRTEYFDVPRTPSGPLLLVPKAIVRRRLGYDIDEYYRDFILPFLREKEEAATILAQTARRPRRITRKEIEAKYGRGKPTVIEATLERPGLLDRYRQVKEQAPAPPLSHADLELARAGRPSVLGETIGEPDYDGLLAKVVAVPAGGAHAHEYHEAVAGLLTAIFYPELLFPRVEARINQGRKRIDISFTNAETKGFFGWVAGQVAAGNIQVECKNYGREIGNPEVDQLIARFSPTRGQVGVLTCRSVGDRSLLDERCRDAALHGQGRILVLEDSDLEALVAAKKEGKVFQFLKDLHDRMIEG